MADESEQTELTEAVEQENPEPPDLTLQDRVMRRYNSDNLFDIAIGFWGKLLAEGSIVALPLGVVSLAVGFPMAYFGIGPVEYWNVIVAWVGFTVTITTGVWCFSDIAVDHSDDDGDELANQD